MTALGCELQELESDPTEIGFAFGGIDPGILHARGQLHEVRFAHAHAHAHGHGAWSWRMRRGHGAWPCRMSHGMAHVHVGVSSQWVFLHSGCFFT